MEVVMPRKLAAVIMLEEICQISGNTNSEDKRNCNPERAVKIRIDSLKSNK